MSFLWLKLLLFLISCLVHLCSDSDLNHFLCFCNLKTGEKKNSLIYFQSVKLVGGKCFAECKEKNRIISLSFLPYSYIFFLLPLST